MGTERAFTPVSKDIAFKVLYFMQELVFHIDPDNYVASLSPLGTSVYTGSTLICSSPQII